MKIGWWVMKREGIVLNPISGPWPFRETAVEEKKRQWEDHDDLTLRFWDGEDWLRHSSLISLERP